MKTTHVHAFEDGNICSLTIDLEAPKAFTATWKNNPPDWSKIEKEYVDWRNDVVAKIFGW